MAKGKVTFVDLPLETQQQIIGHMNRHDLFKFQRLSPHCFSLASAEIYRNLDLNITNSFDEENGIPNNFAADALQTILASEHNYGPYIKSFRLGVAEDNNDPIPVGAPPGVRGSDPLLMTRLLWDSKSDSSKFLNTVLLLMIQKASILENFKWDAPIELSGAVYRALHRITSLRHLRVRLDVLPAPKLQIRANHQAAPGLTHPQSIPHPTQYIPAPPINSTGAYPGQPTTKKNTKRKKAGDNNTGYGYWANPRNFSGFRHLSTLAIMGVSNLECLTEISDCIKSSSLTLKSLTMSLSTDLARKARKPVAVNPELDELSDTELDEDEIADDPMLPPAAATQSTPPTNEADIRKEKLAQEGILAKVFDLQSVAAEGKKIEKKLSASAIAAPLDYYDEGMNIKFNNIMKSLMESPIASDVDPSSNAGRLEHFKMVREVADLYITGNSISKSVPKDNGKPNASSPKKSGPKSKLSNTLASDLKASSSQPHLPLTWDTPGPKSSLSPLGGPLISSSMNETTAPDMSIEFTVGKAPTPFPALLGSSSQSSKSKTLQSSPSSYAAQQQALQQKLLQAQLQNQQLAQLKSQQEQAQGYLSPYGSGSGQSMLSSLSSPYSPNHVSGPTLYDTSDLYIPFPGASTTGQNSTNGLFPDISDYMLQSHSNLGSAPGAPKKTKSKPQKAKKPIPSKAIPTAESADEADSPVKSSSAVQNFFAAEPNSGPSEDAMDVDMEHPDEDTQELGDDQETVPVIEETKTETPRKRAKTGFVETVESNLIDKGGPFSEKPETPAADNVSFDDAMQAYIRTAHGLQLEALSLEWIPLKASIVARALDLSVLRRITLLEVGPQDAFWTLLTRLQGPSTEIAFKSIHTDNVSLPFLKFLSTFQGLEELFIHERSTKQEAQDSTAGPNTLTIRKLALQRHITTLKRLMIKNDRNESWDMDPKTLQFLAHKGTELRELAISLNMKTYHILMQYFAAFRNLYALHLTNLRSGDRTQVILHSESLNFAIDSLSHCPGMKLRYIAIANSVIALESKPDQHTKSKRMASERRKDKKGKGKASPSDISSLLEQLDNSGSDDAEEALAEVIAGESKLRLPTRFGAVEDVKIFSKQIRLGKL